MIDWKTIEKKFKELSNEKESWLQGELAKIRTGRATPAFLDHVRVESYGSFVPLKSVANISVPDARQLLIKPYEPNQVIAVVAAINKAGLGVNPVADGNQIRISFPAPTEESRKQLVKKVAELIETAKVNIRTIRSDLLKSIKTDKTLQEDDYKYYEEQLNKLIKDENTRLENIFKTKEKDVMTI